MTTDDEPYDDTVERVFEIRMGVWCTEARAFDIAERFQLVLCPEPMHEGPCDVPWSGGCSPVDDEEARERFPELVEQVWHERRRTL